MAPGTRKKVLALVLAMAMSLSLAVTASASYNTFDDQAEIVNDEAVFLLNALGIVEGRETGDFDPAANINRAEASKLVAALNLAGVPVPNAKGVSSFSDVLGDGSVAWANNYIEYCVSQGSVNGMGDGTFAPKANVTGVQFAKMLLGILGYDAAKEGYTGTNWMYNVNIDAVDAGLYRGLDIDATAALSRDDAAQMMFNALKAKTVIYLTDASGALKITNKTLMQDIYPTVDGYDAVMTGISYNVDKAEYTYTLDVLGDGKLADKLTTSADYTDMLGMNVMYVTDEVEGVLGMYAYENGAVTTGLWGDYDATELQKDELIDGETVYAQFVPNASSIDLTKPVSISRNAHDFWEYKAIDNDDDGVYDYVIVYPIYIETVSYVGDKTVTTNGGNYDFKDCTIYAGIAKNDVVTVEFDTTLKTVVAIAELAQQKGTVSNYVMTDKIDTIVINGTSYDVCSLNNCAGDLYRGLAGKNVTFYVVNGYAINVVIDDSIALSELLLITAIESGHDSDYTYDAKAMFSDGSIKDIDISKLNGVWNESIDETIAGHLEKTADGNECGYLAKYDEVSGAYELTSMDKVPSPAALGFDNPSHIFNGTFAAATHGDDDAAVKVGNTEIEFADDAIIYLADVSGKDTVYSVATGADMATLTGENVVYYAGYEKAADGRNYITFAFIKTDSVSESAVNYGVLTSGVTYYEFNDSYVDYATFTVWNGTENVTVNAEFGAAVAKNLVKGDVIAYSFNDGKIITLDKVAGAAQGAILAYNPDTYAGKINISGTEYTVDADTAIIGYDSSEDVGAAADLKYVEGKAGADNTDIFDGVTYWKNAYFVADTTGYISVLVVDNTEGGFVPNT